MAGFPADTCRSISSTVPLLASPVGVPSRVQNTPMRRSQGCSRRELMISCGRPASSGEEWLSQPTGTRITLELAAFTSFQS